MPDSSSTHPAFNRTRFIAVLSLLFLVAFTAAFSWQTWKLERERESAYLASMAELGGRSINAYIRQIEVSLQILGEDLVGGGKKLDPERARMLLRRFDQSNLDVANVTIALPDGQLILSNEYVESGMLPHLGDSRSFIWGREALQNGLTMDLGAPMIGAVTGDWVIPLRYGVRDSTGSLQYILTATLPLFRQQTFWINLPLPAETVMGLMRDDGYLLSRYPIPDKVNLENVYGKPRQGGLLGYLQKHDFPQRGVTEGRTSLTGFNNIFAFHRLASYPVTMFIAMPIQNLEAKWWKQARPFYFLMFVFLVSGSGVYFWLHRRQQALQKERAAAEQQRLLAASAMESTMEGIVITDDKGRVASVNSAFTAITGYSADEVTGKTLGLLQSGRHDQEFFANLWLRLIETGSWQGEVWNRRKNGEIYPELLSISAVRSSAGDVTHYVGVFNDISQFKDYESRLEFLANHDPLTRLPNRNLLHDRLEEALSRADREGRVVCLMFIDLDRFKMVNDSLGHEIGDRLLQAVASILQGKIRKSDTLARLGGDEFTIILEQLHNTDEAAVIAQKLLNSLATPIDIDGHQLFVSASIGVSFYPQDGRDVQTLLKHADTAMFRAKDEGRDKYRFFSSEMVARAQEFMLLATSLHSALEKDQIFLEYQPRIDISNGRIVGIEALARWKHPELGVVAPDKFIPIAEETGMIVAIGEWVLRTACRQAKTWFDAGHNLRLSVNLSARQFRKQRLAENLLKIVSETGFNPKMLDVEITESLMMHDPVATKEILRTLNRAGVQVAIDDFGIGYSSLSYLREFPIRYIKIDRSFIRDIPSVPDSIAIVRTIIAMAKNLRLSLIAEGVETQEQLDFLVAEKCGEVQGFLFSRAVSASELEKLLLKTAKSKTAQA